MANHHRHDRRRQQSRPRHRVVGTLKRTARPRPEVWDRRRICTEAGWSQVDIDAAHPIRWPDPTGWTGRTPDRAKKFRPSAPPVPRPTPPHAP